MPKKKITAVVDVPPASKIDGWVRVGYADAYCGGMVGARILSVEDYEEPLSRCPHCGGSWEINIGDVILWHYGRCTTCGMRTDSYRTVEEVRAAINRRPE